MRLLVVEDEKSLRDDITKKLRLDGYEADACGDGNEARELLAVEYYDLVLLDLNLPGVDGMTILREFRAVNDETPVLILSARSEITDKVEGLDAGTVSATQYGFIFRRCAGNSALRSVTTLS